MEQELGDKMVVEVDVTKYRVQPFKSYKVCLSLEDPTMGSLPRTCTHLFSFERAVPYIPEEKEEEEEEEVREIVKEVVREVKEKLESLSETAGRVSEERELWRALEDTENFVRDDFSKVERALGEEEQRRHGGQEAQKRHGHSDAVSLTLPLITLIFTMCL
jgi:hypothetical protein